MDTNDSEKIVVKKTTRTTKKTDELNELEALRAALEEKDKRIQEFETAARAGEEVSVNKFNIEEIHEIINKRIGKKYEYLVSIPSYYIFTDVPAMELYDYYKPIKKLQEKKMKLAPSSETRYDAKVNASTAYVFRDTNKNLYLVFDEKGKLVKFSDLPLEAQVNLNSRYGIVDQNIARESLELRRAMAILSGN